jgi:hypothetical protein
MTTLRTLVLLVQSLVILTIGIAGAAVVDSLFVESWHSMVVSISRAHRTVR